MGRSIVHEGPVRNVSAGGASRGRRSHSWSPPRRSLDCAAVIATQGGEADLAAPVHSPIASGLATAGGVVEGVRRDRVLAIDATRGLALLLMLLDHVGIFTRVNLAAETYLGKPVILGGTGWFAAGLVTNVSAPTFWFLSGASVALMSWRERLRNSTDDFLLIRAGALMLIDMVLVSWEWHPLSPPHPEVRFDLLTCLGISMLLMIPVRRLSDRALILLGATLLAGYAVLVRLAPESVLLRMNFPARVFTTFDDVHAPVVTFPVLGWFGLMVLGTWCGRRLADGRWRHGAPFVRLALAGFGVWVLVRLTGLGSADRWQPSAGIRALVLMRRGPPALDYLAFNLGFGLLALAGFLAAGDGLRRARVGRWMVTWGQAPLFLFVVHLLVGFACARLATHLFRHADAPRFAFTFLAAAALMLPLARGYRRLKESHPHSMIRYF